MRFIHGKASIKIIKMNVQLLLFDLMPGNGLKSQNNSIIIYQQHLKFEKIQMEANHNQVLPSSLFQHQEKQLHNCVFNPLTQHFTANHDHTHTNRYISQETVEMKSSIQLKRISPQQNNDIIPRGSATLNQFNSNRKIQTFRSSLKDLAEQQKHYQEGFMTLLPLSSAHNLNKKQIEQTEQLNYAKSKLDYYDIDQELNENYLPLASMTMNKLEVCLGQPSEDSDDINCFTKRNFNSTTSLNEKKVNLDISQSQELLICQKCHFLMEKNREQAAQISDLIKEIQQLKQPQHKKILDPSSTNSNDDGAFSNISIDIKENLSNSQILAQQLREVLKTMEDIQKDDSIGYPQEQCELINDCQMLLTKIKKKNRFFQNYVDESKLINKIHQRYKKMIQKIQAQHRQQIDKYEEDFKKFMIMMGSKSNQNLSLSHRQSQSKNQLSKSKMRKTKTLIQKEEPLSYNQQQHYKHVIELLEINYEKQKNKVCKYERYLKKIEQNHRLQTKSLMNERNCYRNAANRYQKEFQTIMLKLVSTNVKLHINNSDLFKDVSQRVFQISNCIPFEENDEQSLFAPQNQEQLYDMLEHIRRFYLKIEEFTAKKQRQFFTLKRNFIIFLKDLIQNEKVSVRYMIQLVNQNKDLSLDYIKDYINNLRKKKLKMEQKKYNSPRKIVKGKSLTLTQAESLICINQQSYFQQNKL